MDLFIYEWLTMWANTTSAYLERQTINIPAFYRALYDGIWQRGIDIGPSVACRQSVDIGPVATALVYTCFPWGLFLGPAPKAWIVRGGILFPEHGDWRRSVCLSHVDLCREM